MKGKPAGNSPPPAEQSKPHETWTMRVLKPGSVEEVTFELDEAKTASTSPLGAWKATTPAGNLTGPRSANNEPKLSQPPAQEPPASPSQELPPPKQESKEIKRDRA
jgi:hypothetical protein